MSGVIPQDLEAEEAVLGAMLESSTAREIVHSVGVKVEDFYRPSHRIMFEAVNRHDATGTVDVKLIADDLRRQKQLTEVGGHAAIATMLDRCPGISVLRSYAEQMKHVSKRRRWYEIANEVLLLAQNEEYGGEPVEPPKFDDAMAGLLDAGAGIRSLGFVTLDDLMSQTYDDWMERAETGKVPTIPTGFRDFDRELGGGFEQHSLVILAARPAMGKTSFALNIVRNIAQRSQQVAVFSMEMAGVQLASRMISDVGNVDTYRLSQGRASDSDWDKASSGIRSFLATAKQRVHIDERGSATVAQITHACRALNRRLARKGERLTIVVVDYLQLMEGVTKRGQSRNDEISGVSRGLKRLALELKCPVLALSQLSRDVEKRPDKRPQLSDLRDSGAIEQDADVVAFLYRKKYYFPDDDSGDRSEIIIGKNRHYSIGSAFVDWDGDHTRFLDARVPGVLA